MTYNNYLNYLQQLYTNQVITENSVILQKKCIENCNKVNGGRQSIADAKREFKKSVNKDELYFKKNQEVACKVPTKTIVNNNSNNLFNNGGFNSNTNQFGGGFMMQNRSQNFNNQNTNQFGFSGNNNFGLNANN